MKLIVEQLLQKAISHLQAVGTIPDNLTVEVKVDRTKDDSHGDFATNLALTLARQCGLPPRQLAELLVQALPADEQLERIEIAGPGFINFFMRSTDRVQIISTIFNQGERFGCCNLGKGQRVLLEFVSANPTGPLHVGHGRSAAFGATLGNLLTAAGYDVSREYYVNDAGRQMDILAVSVWLRYLAASAQPIIFPTNAYRGDYVQTMANELKATHGDTFVYPWAAVCDGLPADEPEGGDKERYIDAMIEAAKRLLGSDGFEVFHQYALDTVLDDIKDDLAEFGVTFNTWFSERGLLHDGSIQKGIDALRDGGHTYEQAGALWFRATAFGDEKDRVLVRANGQTTYFASDVAYHWNKYHRGFDRVIDIFGADHHGYVARLKSAVTALGHDEQALNILLVQFAILYRQGERVQMSTRSGSFVTLRELRDEVSNDAARFFYVIRRPEQHMDFDLDLAKSESSDNPVYYIQYAHARICSVLRQLQERGLSWDQTQGLAAVNLLTEAHEQALIVLLNRYPDTIQSAAATCEPHQIAYYLRELANGLHSYYNAVPLLCEDHALRSARLSLLKAVQQVLRNGVTLLGVSAPESM
ncbi:MAG: arginine--tRNA ligase [Legionellaceae bacterium]|nr:arginine--tRNA ligase [Legionellaceae bacterium]